jgi:hypothetical protein
MLCCELSATIKTGNHFPTHRKRIAGRRKAGVGNASGQRSSLRASAGEDTAVAIDRCQRDKSDPSVIVFSEINVVKIRTSLNFVKKQKRQRSSRPGQIVRRYHQEYTVRVIK